MMKPYTSPTMETIRVCCIRDKRKRLKRGELLPLVLWRPFVGYLDGIAPHISEIERHSLRELLFLNPHIVAENHALDKGD